MTTSGPPTIDDDLDDDLAGWQAAPSPRYPHIALLFGGSLLVVVLACVVPVFVVGTVRPGLPRAGLMLTVVVALCCGIGPFVTPRLQNTRYVVVVILFLDLLPAALAAASDPAAPVRQWASLVLIPVLLAAATLGPRLYRVELMTGTAIGVLVLSTPPQPTGERLVICLGFAFFIVVCGSLARQDRSALDLRFRLWQRQSRVDELTRLLNRRGFVARFPDIRRECLDAGVPLGVVMIDIDHFSRLNAVHGHTYGDTVLQRLCAVVAELPEVAEGIVARIGGEELIVVVPRPAESTAVALRAALNRAAVHPGLTVSMGVCDADPRSCTDPDAMWRLVALTDAALYRAKQQGRDGHAVVDVPGTAPATGVVVPPAGPAVVDGVASAADPGPRPAPPRLGPRPLGPLPAVPVPGTPPPDPDDIGDDRLLGAYCLVFTVVGVFALLLPVAVDPDSRWVPVFIAGLVAMAVLGTVAATRRAPARPLLTGVTCVVIEMCTLSAVLASPRLEHRLIIVCILTVPVLVSAHAMPLPWLGGQILLVFVGVGLAAGGATLSIDAEWMYRTLSLAAALCAAPGVLFWLRRRRERANSRLRGLVSIDPLTGVRNRLGLEQGAAVATGRLIHVITCNVVGFKGLNDTYGHVFGDEVLMHLARSLATAAATTGPPSPLDDAGPPPVVGRTGGDRFAVVAADPVDPGLRDRIHRTLQTFPAEVAVSVGEAVGTAAEPVELWAMVAAAESAQVRPPAPRRPGAGGLATGFGVQGLPR